MHFLFVQLTEQIEFLAGLLYTKSMCLLFKSRAITNLACHCLITVFLFVWPLFRSVYMQKAIHFACESKQHRIKYGSEGDQKALKWCSKMEFIGNSVLIRKGK